MTDKKVKLSWSAPVNADGSVYEHLNEYHIHHNVPGTQSPVVVPGGTTTTEETLGAGKYQVGIQTVSNEGFKSSKVITSFEVKDPALREVPRHYGIPVGGVISTNSLITSLGVFKTEETTGWSVATAGAPLHIHSFSTGSADRYSQDCDSIASLTFTGMGVDEGHIKSHYILFDASNSSDPLRLIKYEDTVFSTSNNLNIGYWYDTGDGDTTPESTFVTKTGTVTVGLGASEVVGSGTAFLSEYEIDDIIYFNSTQAAKVTYVSSNTSLTIDRDFTTAISGAIKKQGLTFDTNYDAILYQIRKDAGTFKITPALLIVDTSIYSRSRIAILQATPTLLNFNATPTLTTTYTNLVLTATASGYTKPKFKITGAGFDNSEISQTADTSFQNPTSGRTYVRTLDKVDVFVATDLDFTVTITEESDEDNTDLQNSQTITIPFLKDGSGSGSTGVDAKVVQLTVDDYSIIYDKDGLNPSPSGNMTLTASSQNFTDPYFKFTGDGINDETSYTDGTDASDTFTFAIPTSHFTDPKSLRVGVAESTAATAELSFDSISITAVKPGATGVRGIDGMTFICTNEAHVFNASETGVVGSYANSGTRIEVYEGGTELVYDATSTFSSNWKTTEAATNITVGTKTDSGNYLTVGNHSGVANGTNDSTIIYTITGKRADGTAFTTTVQQSFTKSTKGDTGTTGLQGVSGVDGDDGAGIEYIFAVTADSSTTPSAPTNSWGFDQPNSPWFDAAPSITTTNKALWRAQRAILGNPSVGDSVSASWSSSTVVGRFGDTGASGLQGIQGIEGEDGAGIESIFAKTADSSTSPNTPNNSWGFDQPYNSSVGDAGWYDAAPTINTSNKALWRAQRAIVGNPSAGDSVSASWSGSTVVGRFADDGVQGAQGDDGAGIEYIFAVTADSSTTPSAPTNSWGFDQPINPWYDGAPSMTTSNKALWRAQRAIAGTPSVGDTVSDTWSSSTVVGRFADDGATGATGADGDDGLQGVQGADGDDGAGIEYIFAVTADSSTTPSAPTNSWGFDQPSNPWYDGAPSMTTSNKALWRAQRAILGNPSVGDSVSASWSGSTVVGRFGDDGATGAVGKKTATGYLYYNTQQANAPSAPSNSSVTYYFSNGTMGGGVVSSGAWSLTAPTATTGTSGSKMYYIYWNATETTAGGGTASPGFGSTVYTATNFTGLVRFNGTNKVEDGLGSELSFGSSGTTTIDGAKITTGTIDAARLNVGSISISGFDNDSGFTNDAAANTAQTTANSATTTANSATTTANSAITTANSASTTATAAQTTANSKTTAAEAAAAANAANKAAGKVGGWSISSSYIQGGSGVYIASGKTAYGQTTAGFWLGNVGATPMFDIGNSSTYLRWNGSSLAIKGTITIDNPSDINTNAITNGAGYTDDTIANSAATTANSATTTANAATTTANAATVTANSASTAASNAQTTADGKTTLVAANAAVNANVTSISGGVIQTGTLIAAKIESGNNAIGSSSNKFAFNGTTEYGASGISTVIGATAVNSSTAAGLFFSSGGTSALGVQTNTSGISAGLFFNSSSIGTETYRNRADLANDSYGSVFTDDSGKYAKLATPTEAGWFQDAAATPNYVKLATGTHALYYAGAVGTFTAGHDALLADSESCEVGDILVDQGVAYASSVSDVITNVTRSTSANQKAVIGVFVQENPDHIPVPLAKEIITDIGSGPSAGVSRTHIIDPAHDSIVANKTIIAMNSVGEGQVNVCGESGDIEIGDLISSSSTTGKGMKQADDIVRSCTVGKAREAVTFATAGTVKQIACIYMCG